MAPVPSRRRLLVVGLLLLVAAIAGWWSWSRRRAPEMDLTEVLALNNQGVGLMERFEYEQAAEVFEKVVARAPDWLPGRINLGIALLNAGGTSSPEDLARTRQTFEQVLEREPDNPYAHHCLGVLLLYQKDSARAIRHFEKVTRLDPGDASAWFFLGLLQEEPRRRTECFQKALACDPYHVGALYQVALEKMRTDPARGQELLAAWKALKAAEWGNPTAVKYSEMGRYGEVIGRREQPAIRTGPLPRLRANPLTVRLANGATWAKPDDLGDDPAGKVRRRFRDRFGGVVVVLDFDGDGRPDLFLAGAVVEAGRVRDLLLRNTPAGWVDVTAPAGLVSPFATLGVSVADLDNDGRPDLLLCGIGGVRLFRNAGGGTFEDQTTRAGLDSLGGVFVSAACVDLDQDSDLDLVLARYAPSLEEAIKALEGKPALPGGVHVHLHTGEAIPLPPGRKDLPPLVCRFRKADRTSGLDVPGNVVSVVVTDIDADRDLDLVVLADDRAPVILANDRLLRFRRLEVPTPKARWIGGLCLDTTHAGRSDLLLVPVGESPRLLLSRCVPGLAGPDDVRFDRGVLSSPHLAQASVCDLDLDGWSDVVGLSADRRPVLLHHDGSRLVHRQDAFLDCPLPARIEALLPLVSDPASKDVQPELLVWASEGLSLLRPLEAKNHGLLVQLTGRMAIEPGGSPVRCNADGVGAFVVVQTADLWTGIENVTLSAGPGQSRSGLLLGLGTRTSADVVRLRWPDGTIQAELSLPAGQARIAQANRKKTSCPILFTWDGERYRFVTDFLGAGSLGELLPDGSTRPARAEESVKIESDQLTPREGRYRIELAEPMDETTYLDHLELVAIDHVPAVQVYPDERFATGGRPPTQQLVAFENTVFPVRATDHRGQDVTRSLLHRDRDTVAGFARRSWLGFAEEHHVTLDFGDRLARVRPGERLHLCLAGWTDYPYPESIWAAHQAGVPMLPPVLEQREKGGTWKKRADVGFPAGLPRMMLLDVTDQVGGPDCVLRLRTNLHVYWDQAFVAVGGRTPGSPTTSSTTRVHRLAVESADLQPCGIHQEYSPDGRLPTVYAHDRFDSVPVVRLAGLVTRHGEVGELLRAVDDRFVIFGPGDRLRVRFDARNLPPLPATWKRSFVLRTTGYCKDTGPFTATGTTVEPLPFAGMRRYPGERPPDPARQRDYLRRWNTRRVVEDGMAPRR